MSLVVPNTSESIMLQYLTNNDAPENLVIHLYANDVTPDENTTTATFTEATGGGYASQALIPASFSIVTGSPSQAEHVEITWTFTGAVGNIYGYYVTRQTGGETMWAERFSNGPFNIQTNGDQIKVTPRITLE